MAWQNPTIRFTGDLITASIWNGDVVGNLLAAESVGCYRYQVGAATAVETVIDGGWLECNGVAVSRTTYAALFAKTSIAFGAGNTTTTFNLPAFGGRMPVGLADASGHADVKTLGGSDGVAAAGRRPKHQTSVTGPTQPRLDAGGGGATTVLVPQGARLDGGPIVSGLTVGTGVAGDAVDAPAYLVGGIWQVKF